MQTNNNALLALQLQQLRQQQLAAAGVQMRMAQVRRR
jgi:hypothetical protein